MITPRSCSPLFAPKKECQVAVHHAVPIFICKGGQFRCDGTGWLCGQPLWTTPVVFLWCFGVGCIFSALPKGLRETTKCVALRRKRKLFLPANPVQICLGFFFRCLWWMRFFSDPQNLRWRVNLCALPLGLLLTQLLIVIRCLCSVCDLNKLRNWENK